MNSVVRSSLLRPCAIKRFLKPRCLHMSQERYSRKNMELRLEVKEHMGQKTN